MKVYANYQLPRKATPEKLSKKSKVEVETYLPLDRQIKTILESGKRLVDMRRFNYDLEHAPQYASKMVDADVIAADDKLQIDPTRYPGFSVADAQRMSNEVNRRIDENKQIIMDLKKKVEDGKKSSPDVNGVVSDANKGVSPTPVKAPTVPPTGGAASSVT